MASSKELDAEIKPPKKFKSILQVDIKTVRILLDKLNTLDRGSGFKKNKKAAKKPHRGRKREVKKCIAQ